MKNTMKKSSIIAICISLAIVMFAVILTTQANFISNKSVGTDLLNAADGVGSWGTDLYANDTNPDKDAYISDSEGSALSLAALIMLNKSGVSKVTLCDPDESSHRIADNLSQVYYNKLFKDKYNIEINGTCSLIAMIIVSDVLGVNDRIDLSYANCTNEEERNLAILKELYDISIKYENDYSVTRSTKTNTFIDILSEFYANHGYNFSAMKEYVLKSDLRKNVYEKMVTPALISIYNYTTQYGYEGKAHTVALVGTYNIKMEYIKNLFKTKGVFHAFLICNGWENSSDNRIGANYQILIFNTNVSHNVQLLNFLGK